MEDFVAALCKPSEAIGSVKGTVDGIKGLFTGGGVDSFDAVKEEGEAYNESCKSAVTTGLIIAIVVMVLCCACCIGIPVYIIVRNKKQRQKAANMNQQLSSQTVMLSKLQKQLNAISVTKGPKTSDSKSGDANKWAVSILGDKAHTLKKGEVHAFALGQWTAPSKPVLSPAEIESLKKLKKGEQAAVLLLQVPGLKEALFVHHTTGNLEKGKHKPNKDKEA